MEPKKIDKKRILALIFSLFSLMFISSVWTFDLVTKGIFNAGTRSIMQIMFWVTVGISLLISYSRKENREIFKKNWSKKSFFMWVVVVAILTVVLFAILR